MSGPEMTRRGGRYIGVAVSFGYIVLWSSASTAIKFGVRYAPPLTFLTIRFLFAGALLAMFARWLGHPWPAKPRAWIRLGILGLLNVGAPAALNFIAMKYASASIATMVFVANPLMLALIAPRLLGEKLTRSRILGLTMGFVGVAYVMLGRLGGKGREDSPTGIILLLVAVVCMVAATVAFKRFPPREPLMMVNVVQQLVSGAVLIPLVLAFEHPSRMVLSGTFVVAFLHLVLVVSIGAGFMWFWLLGRGDASVASSSYFLAPILGLIYAALLLGEALTVRDGIGLVAIMVGVVLIRRSPSVPAARKGATIRPPPPPVEAVLDKNATAER